MQRWSRNSLVGCLLVWAPVVHCSGGGGGGSVGPTPATLVSTCDQICANVVAQCSESVALEMQCTNACGALGLAPLGCLDPFASYLSCLAGATSVQCEAGGQDVVITTPQCASDREAVLSCNAPPGPVAACVELPPGNTSCGLASPGGPTAMFCVGAPANCDPSPSPNPLGIGTYCCP